ncbi:MAG: methyltransferase domain-containing protein [Ardenticatenaceae bacterium]|nr:methyltransferase domain-containing protein [Ardenticatenaceae bacterium]
MDWWQEFFDESYLKRYAREPEMTAAEVAMLCELLPAPPASVLDVACGQGRHSIPLAAAGYAVTGLDASPYLLSVARKAAAAAGVTIEFIEADICEGPATERFDAAINMFTAFGYFEDDAQNQRALNAMARALKPGGYLIMEMAHRDRVVANFRETDWYELDDGTIVWERRHFDAVRGLNTVVERWRTPDGVEDERYHRVRLYTATELDRMLRVVGLTPTAWFGDTALHTFTHEAPRLVVMAEKREIGVNHGLQRGFESS